MPRYNVQVESGINRINKVVWAESPETAGPEAIKEIQVTSKNKHPAPFSILKVERLEYDTPVDLFTISSTGKYL